MIELRCSWSIALFASSVAATGCQHGEERAAPALAAPAATTSASEAAPAPAKGGPCVELDEKQCTAKCDAGDMTSCARLASMYDKVIPTAVSKDPARTRAILEKACAARSGHACQWLSSLLGEGRGGPKDPARAAELLKTALSLLPGECEQGSAESCSDLAFAYSMGTGVAKDRASAERFDKRAAELRGAACDAGDASSCGSHAEALWGADPKRALAYLEKGCSGGDPFSCQGLGRRYDEGEGVAKDAEKARASFARACKGGLTGACDQTGASK